MKPIMSEQVREILDDPEQKKELLNGIKKLHRVSKSNKREIKICIGNKKYNIRFVRQSSRR